MAYLDKGFSGNKSLKDLLKEFNKEKNEYEKKRKTKETKPKKQSLLKKKVLKGKEIQVMDAKSTAHKTGDNAYITTDMNVTKGLSPKDKKALKASVMKALDNHIKGGNVDKIHKFLGGMIKGNESGSESDEEEYKRGKGASAAVVPVQQPPLRLTRENLQVMLQEANNEYDNMSSELELLINNLNNNRHDMATEQGMIARIGELDNALLELEMEIHQYRDQLDETASQAGTENETVADGTGIKRKKKGIKGKGSILGNIGQAFSSKWNEKAVKGSPEDKFLKFFHNEFVPRAIKPIEILAPPVGEIAHDALNELKAHQGYGIKRGRGRPRKVI